MRVYNIYSQPVSNNKYNNVNFSAKTISTSYGLLSKAAQQGLENLHLNLQSIQDLFLKFAHYPAKAIAIKDGYSALLQKNRNQGLSFELPDKQGIMTIRQLRSNTELLRFIVEKDGEEKHFLTDGTMKVVANINKNNPQFLPRKFRYMQLNEIKDSNIENYIKYADEEIQKYNDYLNQYRDANKYREVKIERKEKADKTTLKQIDPKEIKDTIDKAKVKRVVDIFQKKPTELPENIIPTVGTRNNIIGLKTIMDDGATLKVSKKVNVNYGSTMTYLSFEKLNQDGSKSYMSIDLNTFKFLRMKDAGKPLIKEHSVYEYSAEEIKKRNMAEKFNTYADAILSGIKKQKTAPKEQTVEPVAEKIKPTPEQKIEIPAVQQEAEALKDVQNEIKQTDTKLEQLKKLTIQKAKEDAKTLSELYFETFVESFNKNVMQKFADFKVEFEKLFLKN